MDISLLPAVNATLNGICCTFLLTGWFFIKRDNRKAHVFCMSMALVCSALFLACYLYYHFHAGVTKFPGLGIAKNFYYFILATHVPLATLIVPFIIWAVVAAVSGKFETHKRITKYLLPTWLYVSITGVLIYFMLYQWYPSAAV